ncbi:unnamed protein product [Caenorhabditis auriculariae]|uniref:Uncharacterized protein n=1 Tax=Caenorhabditis auriculariae TaxID=2777116 RepID=A0A8S1HDT8_9PELO|nr:unnamed protein product [Caenorhabditis auriculariae]
MFVGCFKIILPLSVNEKKKAEIAILGCGHGHWFIRVRRVSKKERAHLLWRLSVNKIFSVSNGSDGSNGSDASNISNDSDVCDVSNDFNGSNDSTGESGSNASTGKNGSDASNISNGSDVSNDSIGINGFDDSNSSKNWFENGARGQTFRANIVVHRNDHAPFNKSGLLVMRITGLLNLSGKYQLLLLILHAYSLVCLLVCAHSPSLTRLLHSRSLRSHGAVAPELVQFSTNFSATHLRGDGYQPPNKRLLSKQEKMLDEMVMSHQQRCQAGKNWYKEGKRLTGASEIELHLERESVVRHVDTKTRGIFVGVVISRQSEQKKNAVLGCGHGFSDAIYLRLAAIAGRTVITTKKLAATAGISDLAPCKTCGASNQNNHTASDVGRGGDEPPIKTTKCCLSTRKEGTQSNGISKVNEKKKAEIAILGCGHGHWFIRVRRVSKRSGLICLNKIFFVSNGSDGSNGSDASNISNDSDVCDVSNDFNGSNDSTGESGSNASTGKNGSDASNISNGSDVSNDSIGINGFDDSNSSKNWFENGARGQTFRANIVVHRNAMLVGVVIDRRSIGARQKKRILDGVVIHYRMNQRQPERFKMQQHHCTTSRFVFMRQNRLGPIRQFFRINENGPSDEIGQLEARFPAELPNRRPSGALTTCAGGNHEASGRLAELPNGGWVAPSAATAKVPGCLTGRRTTGSTARGCRTWPPAKLAGPAMKTITRRPMLVGMVIDHRSISLSAAGTFSHSGGYGDRTPSGGHMAYRKNGHHQPESGSLFCPSATLTTTDAVWTRSQMLVRMVINHRKNHPAFVSRSAAGVVFYPIEELIVNKKQSGPSQKLDIKCGHCRNLGMPDWKTHNRFHCKRLQDLAPAELAGPAIKTITRRPMLVGMVIDRRSISLSAAGTFIILVDVVIRHHRVAIWPTEKSAILIWNFRLTILSFRHINNCRCSLDTFPDVGKDGDQPPKNHPAFVSRSAAGVVFYPIEELIVNKNQRGPHQKLDIK